MIKRRTMLTGLLGVGGLAAVGATYFRANTAVPKLPPLPQGEWANWSRNQVAMPASFVQPTTTAQLRSILLGSKDKVRVVGAGHSFTRLIPTAGTLINLDDMSQQPQCDVNNKTASVSAGARLRDLSPAFEKHGLAFKNLGDINVQSLAGATGTATHGTGKSFPCLSGELSELTIMLANGELLSATSTQNSDVLAAGQVSLGALGILLNARVKLRDSFHLHRRSWVMPIGDVLASAMSRWNTHRNFEFFYIPFSGYAICIAHDETDKPVTPRPEADDDHSLMLLKQVRDLTAWNDGLRRRILEAALKGTAEEDTVGVGWQLLSSQRNVRFNEMEYHLPVDRALPVLAQVIKTIEEKLPEVWFPIEVRYTSNDDAWLSPFQGAPRISIAVHSYYKENHQWFYDYMEPLFRAAGGRPHWGKLHSLKGDQLRDLYPDFDKFRQLRRALDPQDKFLTPYMAQLFGESVNT